MAKRNIYLEDLPMDEAWGRFTAALEGAGLWRAFPGGPVALPDALGRVTAETVWARTSAPHYHASAMDGYAVRARDTETASERHPLTLNLIQDDAEAEAVERPAKAVDTGGPLPLWSDSVIMIEAVNPGDTPDSLLIRAPVAPWTHIRKMGEDMIATELVLPANHRLRPVDLGALAGCGHSTVSVRRRPRVAILPTGSELVTVEDAAGGIRPGQIIEYNSIMLAAQVSEWGGEATRYPITPDNLEALTATVREAGRGADLVLVNAGSSAGSRDYTVHALRALGEILVHGIAVRPGHPVIFAMLEIDGRTLPAVGVPGYPVSAALTGEIFIRPLLRRWLGLPDAPPPEIEGTMTRKVLSPAGDDEYMRVTVGRIGDRTVVTPLSRGAGVISSLVRADGLAHLPRFSEGLNAGDRVQVMLYRDRREVENTIVAMGSHDVALDLLAGFLAERAPGTRLVSANVGSLGGLIALKRGEAHLAGCHLLDPDTGDYNRRYLAEMLPGEDLRLITLAEREQGLMVPAGNPLAISGIADLARAELRIMNRQRGAGTRLLLDYELDQLGIIPDRVRGYDREETTHLGVAAAVAGGLADCGLGIRAAAGALGLDFVPVGWERYDLAILAVYAESPLLSPLLDLLADDRFRAAVGEMPGYRVGRMGERQ